MLPRTRTSQVSHSSLFVTPLSRLPHLRVEPVRGLAVVYRLATLDAAWSTNKSHRKRTVRESLTAWTHEVMVARKECSSLLSCFLPLTAGTHWLYLRTEGSASLLCKKKLFLPLTAGTRQIWWLTCGPTKRMCTQGFVNLINK